MSKTLPKHPSDRNVRKRSSRVLPVVAASEDSANAEGEDSAEDAEERLVDAFDSEVDKWMEPTESDVAIDVASDFIQKFRAIPADRQEECLQRALNLVPDENAFLLAALLFSADVRNEHKELIFNDFLNREDTVKQPILMRVWKDRSHPCWKDAAWILDVTGSSPTIAK